jgi:hypothetical protein
MKKPFSRFLPLLPLALASCVVVVDDSGKGGSSSKLSVDDGGCGVWAGSAAGDTRNPGVHAMEKGVFPYPVHEKRLANGLLVLVVPMPSEGLVSYWSVVRTGSRDEVEKGVTGFAHFFEHMMFRGTEKYPGDVYDKIVNGMGADANAFTSSDITAYHLSITKEDLPTVVEIESDRFQNLAYDEAEFQTEAGAVYGEYRKNRASPFGVLDEALRNAAFDVHTYKHTTIGFEADIQAMPEHYEYSKTFFQRFYRPENVVILSPATSIRQPRPRSSSRSTPDGRRATRRRRSRPSRSRRSSGASTFPSTARRCRSCKWPSKASASSPGTSARSRAA